MFVPHILSCKRPSHALRLKAALAEESMDPENLTRKDVALAIIPFVLLLFGLVSIFSGNMVLGLVVLVPVILFYAYGLTKIPWKELGRQEYENERRQKQSAIGRVWVYIKRSFDYLSILYLAVLLFFVASLVVRKFGGG